MTLCKNLQEAVSEHVMGYMKNMVSHKICFQSPTLQDMATTQFVKKEKPLSMEGGYMLMHIPEWS